MMTTHIKRPAKRRGHKALVNILLLLALGVISVLIYKQILADAAGLTSEKEGVSADEDGFKLIKMDKEKLTQGELALVNKEHPYDFPEHRELAAIFDQKNDSYFVRDKNVRLDPDVIDHMNDLMEAFCKETGVGDVNVVSGYRTYEDQQKLYDDSLTEKGRDYTDEYVAPPGFSEHHSGLAVDLSIYHIQTGKSEEFDGKGKYGWFYENAWKYGFVLRYDANKSKVTGFGDEPWHFRYVGEVHASYMKEHDLCLEEYINLLREHPYDGEHLKISLGKKTYETYFCKGTDVRVPKDGHYAISGNNADGFIVTAEM
jgi:D-alanyl-D-alanine carboxypeptidase